MAFFKKAKYLEKADKLISQNKLGAAIQELLKYNSKAPDDYNIVNRIGDLYAQIGETDKAVEYFQKSVDHYQNEGFNAKAIAILKKITRVDPDNIRVFEQLAELYISEGNKLEAKRQYLAIVEQCLQSGLNKRALEIYGKIVDLDPQNVDLQLKLAELYVKNGQNDKAVKQLLSLGKSLFEGGKYEDSVKILQKTKKLGVKEPEIDILIAKALIKVSNFAEAENTLTEAMKEYPNNKELIELFGIAKLEQNKFSDAYLYLSKAFELDSSNPEYLEKFVNRLLDEGELQKAWKAADILIKHYTLVDGSEKSVALLKSFIIKSDRFIPALEKLVEVFDKEKDRVYLISTLEKLGVAYRIEKQFQKAEGVYRKLIKLVPNNIDYKNTLNNIQKSVSTDSDIALGFENELTVDSKRGEEKDLTLEDPIQAVKGTVAEAEMYLEYGYKDKAYVLLKKLLQSDPKHSLANKLFGRLCAEKGEIAKASKCYLTAAEEYLNVGKKDEAAVLLAESEKLLPGSSAFLKRMLEKKDSMEFQSEVSDIEFEDMPELDLESLSESLDDSMEELDLGETTSVRKPIDVAESVDEDMLFLTDDEAESEGLGGISIAPEDDLELELDLTAGNDEDSNLGFEGQTEGEESHSEAAGMTLSDEEDELSLSLDDSVVLESSIPEPELPAFDDVRLDNISLEESKVVHLEEMNLAEDSKEEDLNLEPDTGNLPDLPDVDISDEIAEIEFYLSQQLIDEAKDILSSLEKQYPNHTKLKELRDKVDEMEQADEIAESVMSRNSSNFEDLFQEEFIDLKDELGADMDMFGDNIELTDKQQPKEEVKSLEELFHDFKKGVEEQIDDQDYETHYNLGIAYKEMGLYNEAVEEFAKASHDEKRFLDCCFMIASVYEEIGDTGQAVEWLESGVAKAAELGKDDKPLLFEAGSILERAGETEKAQSFFKKVYDKDSAFRNVGEKI
jgi:tetratricopeptide (TPR) repeat protein